MSEVAELVSLVSFLVANEGISLREAAKATHRTPKRLLSDLDRMVMCGVPPYTPSDYINYSLRGVGDQARIRVNFAGHFARPLNFTPQEALALKYALEHFSRSADPESLKQAEDMIRLLREALHGRAQELLSDRGKGFVTPRRTERMRRMIGLLSKAVEERRVVEIEYYSAHRARLATRTVHPFAVLEIGAHFYLYAWCALAGDTRHFRLDRIRDARLLEERFAASAPKRREAGRMDSLFHGTPKDRLVVRFSREVAREVCDEWEGSPDVQIRPLRDGRAEIETPLYNQFWAIGFVMGFGDQAELLQPKWMRKELEQTVRQSLKAHG
ncbi:MAG: WYL domain-containing protein [Planctomycetes bacterium]|nr:WYL domain-containing protein [Planctomycetota bacterium]MCB9934156.1 WYL domain-containing protein [Planctomycetota bacterium]